MPTRFTDSFGLAHIDYPPRRRPPIGGPRPPSPTPPAPPIAPPPPLPPPIFPPDPSFPPAELPGFDPIAPIDSGPPRAPNPPVPGLEYCQRFPCLYYDDDGNLAYLGERPRGFPDEPPTLNLALEGVCIWLGGRFSPRCAPRGKPNCGRGGGSTTIDWDPPPRRPRPDVGDSDYYPLEDPEHIFYESDPRKWPRLWRKLNPRRGFDEQLFR
jgi:hypothetical protein